MKTNLYIPPIDFCDYEGKLCRVYDSELHSSEDVFLNEILFSLEDLLKSNLKLFFVNTTYKQHNVLLKKDLEFFKKYRRCSNDNIPELPINLKRLRDLQSQDLLYFYDNLLCEMFCIFSEITNNHYHYNLLIAVKPDCDLNLIYKNKFNLIEIVSISQIFSMDINYNFIKSLFNFDKLGNYSFSHYSDADYDEYIKNVELKLKNSNEYLVFKNFRNKYPDTSKLNEKLFKEYLYFSNDVSGLRSEIIDQRVYYNFIFKYFGWHIFLLNYEFSDNIYYLSSELKNHLKIKHTYYFDSIFLLKEYGRMFIESSSNLPDYLIKGYSPGCLLDVIFMLNGGEQGDDYCYNIGIYEISIPKIKYGTKYKQRLEFLKN